MQHEPTTDPSINELPVVQSCEWGSIRKVKCFLSHILQKGAGMATGLLSVFSLKLQRVARSLAYSRAAFALARAVAAAHMCTIKATWVGVMNVDAVHS